MPARGWLTLLATLLLWGGPAVPAGAWSPGGDNSDEVLSAAPAPTPVPVPGTIRAFGARPAPEAAPSGFEDATPAPAPAPEASTAAPPAAEAAPAEVQPEPAPVVSAEPAPEAAAPAPKPAAPAAEAAPPPPKPAAKAPEPPPEPAPKVAAPEPKPEPAPAPAAKAATPAPKPAPKVEAPAPKRSHRARAVVKPPAPDPAPKPVARAEAQAPEAAVPPVSAPPEGSAAPEPEAASPLDAAAPTSLPTSLVDAWNRVRRAATGTVDVPALAAAIKALEAARDAEGLDNLETAAVALADWAGQATDRGDAAAAEALSGAAVGLAPGAPEGYLVRARMYWAQGRLAAAAGWTARAAAVGLSHYWVGLAWLGYGVIVFWLAAATALVVLLLPGLAQGIRTLHHMLLEYAGFRAPSAWVMAGCLSLLALPIVAGWGPGWTVLLWAMGAWAADPARNRRAQVLLLMAVLLGPWLCAPLLAPSREPSPPVEMALLEGGGSLPAAAVPPPEALPVGEDGWRVAFALGNAALRDGAYDEAIAWYRQAQEAGGDSVRLTHNIATADFRAGRFDAAERRLRDLAEHGNAPARTWFNLGQAQSRRLDFDAARVSFEQARKADPNLYVRIARTAGARQDIFVVPFGVSNGDSRAMLLSNGAGWGDLVAPLWRFLFAGLPVWMAPLLLAGAAGLAWLLPRLMVASKIYRCDVCHGSVCQECMQFVHDAHLCRACAGRFAETRGTAADIAIMRDRRMRLEAPARRVALALVPGLRDLSQGRHARAALHLVVLAFLVWGMVLLGTVPAWAVSTPLAGWPVARWCGGLLVAAHVGWSVLSASRAELEAAGRRRGSGRGAAA